MQNVQIFLGYSRIVIFSRYLDTPTKKDRERGGEKAKEEAEEAEEEEESGPSRPLDLDHKARLLPRILTVSFSFFPSYKKNETRRKKEKRIRRSKNG